MLPNKNKKHFFPKMVTSPPFPWAGAKCTDKDIMVTEARTAHNFSIIQDIREKKKSLNRELGDFFLKFKSEITVLAYILIYAS